MFERHSDCEFSWFSITTASYRSLRYNKALVLGVAQKNDINDLIDIIIFDDY